MRAGQSRPRSLRSDGPREQIRAPLALTGLKPALDQLYLEYNQAAALADPVEFVRPYADPADREVAGFFAAGLAFGRVASVNASVARVLDVLGARPAEFVRGFEARRDARALEGFTHRWTRGRDLVDVLSILRRMLRECGSIEAAFVRDWDHGAEDVTEAIESFGRRALSVHLGPRSNGTGGHHGAAYFFPRPSRGSACKRMNLYLRWMVRRDAVDPGGWTRVRPAQLVVPLDTHVIRVGQCLGLTRYHSPGWKMAREITSSLRAIDPDDPVRYDFALCHLGMQGLCGLNREQGDSACPLRGACRPGPRRPRASRAPSARR